MSRPPGSNGESRAAWWRDRRRCGQRGPRSCSADRRTGGHGGPSPSRSTHSEWRVGGQRRPSPVDERKWRVGRTTASVSARRSVAARRRSTPLSSTDAARSAPLDRSRRSLVSRMSTVADLAAHRRTFAIISHPDAGKTTLTEKFLLYGGAVQEAGQVKARGERTARPVRLDGARAEARHLDHVGGAAVPLPATTCSTCSTRPATATSPRTPTACSPPSTPPSWCSTRPRASRRRRSSCSRSAGRATSRCSRS